MSYMEDTIELKVLALLVRLTAAGLPARRAAPLARAAVAAAVTVDDDVASIELGPGLCLMVRDI